MIRSSSPPVRIRSRPRRPFISERPLLILLGVLLLLPTVAGARAAPSIPVVVLGPPAPGGGQSDAIGPNLLPVLTVSTAVNWTIPSSFWGADVRPYYVLGTNQTSAFRARPLAYTVWPGGATGDEYNYTSNLVYSDNGSSYAPPTNESQFISWCRSVGCDAIFQLPGEIDSPSTAAYYVRYTLSTLHFQPSYWEIGNEPSLWTHFGIPWTLWQTSQNVNATPTTYAQLVQSYAKAIRAVDPSAHLIGLPGVGSGGWGEAGWIQATVQLNGPNLSAVAIHVYPAGGTTSTATLSSFFGTLTGSGSIPYRVPRDRAAILSACPTCTNLSLFITELGSGNLGGPFQTMMSGYPEVPYDAAEVVQAIQAHVTNVDLFALQSNYPGSLLNTSSVPTGIESLYSKFLGALQPVVLNYSLRGLAPNVDLLPTRNSAGTEYTLLAVNPNASLAVRIGFSGLAFPYLNTGSEWLWDGSSRAPIASSWLAGAGPIGFLLPPRSVVAIEVA
jgi:hypothetical protein